MKKRTFTPISALIGVLLLALAAAMTLFVADSNIAHAQQSNDATLETLTLQYDSDGDGNYDNGPAVLSPTFASGTTSYTAKPSDLQGIPSQVNRLYISADPNNDNATIPGKTDLDTGSDGVQYLSQTLTKGGKTTINITVRAQNGSTKTYSVTVYRKRSDESKNANLSGLSLSSGSLTPGFSSSQIEYDARVATGVSSVTVSYTPSDNAGGVTAAVAVTGTGTSIDSNNPKKVNLTAAGAESTITVTVTPEAGAGENSANNKVYTIKVYRLNDNPEANADLTGITVNDGSNDEALSPGFGANITSYNVSVDNADDVVTVTANKGENTGARVSITPADARGNVAGHQVNLAAGSAVNVQINVTAEDTSISKTYTVKVYRKRSTLSEVDTLSALSLSVGSLSPGFSSSKTSYDARVASNISKVTVSATPTDNAGGVGITVTQEGGTSVSGMEVTLGSAGSTTTITVAVRAEDGGETKDYTIRVYRARNALLGQANLSTLSITPVGGAIANEDNVNLATGDFTARVTNAATAVTVGTTLQDATGATRVITPADSITSGDNATGHQVALTAGQTTTITIVVTAEDGVETKTYTVKVYRQGATLSDVNTLSALSLSAGTLSPAFMTAGVDYKARVTNSVEKTTVSATPTDNSGGAMVEVGTLSSGTDCNQNFTAASKNEVSLTAGANTLICVRVDPEEGAGDNNQNRKNYEVTVYRERANLSDEASLTAFSIVEATGTISDPDGDSNTSGNSIDLKSVKKPDVVYRVRAVTVTATADVGAIVTITPADADAARAGHQVALTEGAYTDITVTVQPEDSTVDAKTYSASVYRKNASTRLSKDATLKELSFGDVVVLTPEFDPATTSYTAVASYSAKQATLTATPNHAGARINPTTGITPGDADTADSAPGHQINFAAPGGKYTVTVKISAEDGTTTETYTVEVTRAATAGTDATLSSLSLTDGAGMDIALTPTFDAATNAYTASVDSTVTEAMVMARAAGPGTKVEVMYGADDTKVTAGADGSYGVPLTDGANTVKVMVTAEDGTTTMTYTVGITVSTTLFDRFDTDDNGKISHDELVLAIEEFFEHLGTGDLTRDDIVTLIGHYFDGLSG